HGRDQLDEVERVGRQVAGKALVQLDLVRVDAEDLGGHLLQVFEVQLAHGLGRSLGFSVQLRLADDQGRVVAAETEGVGNGDLDLGRAGPVGDVIEVALGILVVEVDGGRQHAALDGQHAGGGLHGAGRPQKVGVDRLGRAHCQLV